MTTLRRRRAPREDDELRVDELLDEKARVDSTHDTPSGAFSSEVAHKWLASRQDSTRILPPGEDRPLTRANIRLAASLAPLLFPRFLMLFLHAHHVRVALFILGRLLEGLLPAAKIWASAQMLDMVQESFQRRGGPIDPRKILSTAAISLLASTSQQLFSFVTTSNNTIVRQYLDHHVEGLYLATQLSLDIPTLSNLEVSALLYEAGCFAGFESRNMRPRAGPPGRMRFGGVQKNKRSPYGMLNNFFSAMTNAVKVGSAALLLLRTLRQAANSPVGWMRTYSQLTYPLNRLVLPSESLILIILSFLPSAFSLLGTFFQFQVPTTTRPKKAAKAMRKGRDDSWQKTQQELTDIKEIGRNGSYKQEVVLFDLKEWIMARWEDLRRRQIENELHQNSRFGWYMLGFGAMEEAVQTSFYTLIALGSLSSSISLGAMRRYQSTAESLLNSLRQLMHSLEDSVQVIFYMAAFFEAIELQKELAARGRRSLVVNSHDEAPSLRLIDYESTRFAGGGGMRIEARNLGFTYPGMTKPVLRNINLVLEPGETLAIVGFNGGGKTTLVKVLMGLYDHTGELLVNGHPIESFNPAQLHARTTCCFQDHSKYSLTLRENIGIGDVRRLEARDDAAIQEALERGGAEAVARQVGLDGMLNRHGVPDVGNGRQAEGEGQDQEDQGVEGLLPPPPPPGPPPAHMRGGGDGGGGLFSSNGVGGGRRGGQPPGPPPPEVMAAFEAASAGRGPGTGTGDQRTPLSGGQWQRLALSRAFMRADEADLVVFDEPSSALDARAEADLFARIHALSSSSSSSPFATTSTEGDSAPTSSPRRDVGAPQQVPLKPPLAKDRNASHHRKKTTTTTIYISHRFSTVRRADKIAVVEDGTIKEFGTHDQLMTLVDGRYAELFTLQKQGFE